jgi:hypothetical protein
VIIGYTRRRPRGQHVREVIEEAVKRGGREREISALRRAMQRLLFHCAFSDTTCSAIRMQLDTSCETGRGRTCSVEWMLTRPASSSFPVGKRPVTLCKNGSLMSSHRRMIEVGHPTSVSPKSYLPKSNTVGLCIFRNAKEKFERPRAWDDGPTYCENNKMNGMRPEYGCGRVWVRSVTVRLGSDSGKTWVNRRSRLAVNILSV